MDTRRVEIGQVRSVHPARRELRLTPERGFDARRISVAWIFLRWRDGTELRCRVQDVRVEPRALVVTLAPGVTRDNVARAVGAVVMAEAVAPAAGRFRVADLLSLEAVDVTGDRLGTVTDVVETGANDVIEVTRGDGSSLLLPVIDAVIVSVDVAQGRVTLGDIAPYKVESPQRRGRRRHAD